MTPEVEKRFFECYRRLIVLQLRAQLNIVNEEPSLSIQDVKFLIGVASQLALDSPLDLFRTNERKMWAYDVSTRLVEAYGQNLPGIVKATDFILSRLGNFPGRDLLRRTFPRSEADSTLRHPSLTLEALSREWENSVTFPNVGDLILTDFQFKLADSLLRSKTISISAPTSAGKSFVLAHDILLTLAKQDHQVIVYLVPTRALIQQVTNDLLAMLRNAKFAEVIVSAAPIGFDPEDAKAGIIYVLTQERLVSLLDSKEFKAEISKLYVDEAQEIADSDRGLILDTAIREVVKRFPKANYCFASPLTKNPGYILNEFDLASDGEFFVEGLSPVAQIIVNLEPVKGKTKAASASVVTSSGSFPIGQFELTFKFNGVWERLAQTALLVRRPDESVIVFANRPVDAVEIADKISRQIPDKTHDKDVLDLIDFVKSHVHPRYALADTLVKGVAFHYGRMPHIIRSQIEWLLRKRKLQFVASTSTLLQGVNLPARHIVVLSPKESNGRRMTAPDFWNLAGRAGRLRENFNGIVWCIDPSSWESKPFDGEKLSEIKSAFQKAIEDPAVREAVVAVLDGTVPLPMVQNRTQVEQLLGKAFSEFTLQDARITDSNRLPEELKTQVHEIEEKLLLLRNRIRVPNDVCSSNSTISPTLLDDLWGRFEVEVTPQMLPVDPYRSGSIEHFRTIFKIISEIFIGSEGNSWRYFATLAYHWVWGNSLKELIDDRIEYYKISSDRKSVNRAIRELLDDIELTVRFTYVKYVKAYTDVLRSFLLSAGKTTEAEGLVPWDLYLEFGARDRVLLMLMSVGLSRSTAIAVRKAITPQAEISRKDCWNRISTLPLRVVNIPSVCKAEIRELTGNAN